MPVTFVRTGPGRHGAALVCRTCGKPVTCSKGIVVWGDDMLPDFAHKGRCDRDRDSNWMDLRNWMLELNLNAGFTREERQEAVSNKRSLAEFGL